MFSRYALFTILKINLPSHPQSFSINSDSMSEHESVVKLESPCTIIVSGASFSGKSTLIKKMLTRANGVFKVPPSKIIYCYSIWQEKLFEEIKDTVENISFHKGLVDEEVFNSNDNVHSICVIDDLMVDVADSKFIQKLFCVGSHHLNWTMILIIQNLYQKGKVMRTISLNCRVFIIFRNSRDQGQVKTLARQMFPDNVNYFLDAYRKSTAVPYGYLVIDITPTSIEQYQLRSRILPGEDMIIYVPKQQ